MNELKERLEKSNNSLVQLQKDKSVSEEMIIKREEKLNILFDRINLFEEMIKKKTRLLKENELYSKELIKIIEEQKEEIRELEKNNGNLKYISYNNKSKDNERYINNTRDNYNDMNNIYNNQNENEIVLPNIYNNSEDKSKQNNENEKVDFDLNKNEEENNNNKLNEFKNLIDDLYNNATN